MKAVALTRYIAMDDPASLLDVDLPVPRPAGRDLLVAVRAVAVNQLDNRVRTPKTKIEPAPRVLGWDAAGVVEAVGPEVTRFRPGDRVYYAGDIMRPGSYSEYQLVDERIAGTMPASLPFEAAAAFPLATITAWEAIFDRLRVPMPEASPASPASMLIIGGGGGVGSIAVQLAAKVAGLTVIATASRPASQEWVRSMGAHHVIDHGADIPAQLQAIGMADVDYVLILADTDRYYETAARVVAPQGSICTVVEAKKPIDFGLLWDKSVTLAWEMVFTRTDFQTADLCRQGELLDQAARLINAGTIVPIHTHTLAPIDAARVHRALSLLQGGGLQGKIVLKDFHGDVPAAR